MEYYKGRRIHKDEIDHINILLPDISGELSAIISEHNNFCKLMVQLADSWDTPLGNKKVHESVDKEMNIIGSGNSDYKRIVNCCKNIVETSNVIIEIDNNDEDIWWSDQKTYANANKNGWIFDADGKGTFSPEQEEASYNQILDTKAGTHLNQDIENEKITEKVKDFNEPSVPITTDYDSIDDIHNLGYKWESDIYTDNSFNKKYLLCEGKAIEAITSVKMCLGIISNNFNDISAKAVSIRDGVTESLISASANNIKIWADDASSSILNLKSLCDGWVDTFIPTDRAIVAAIGCGEKGFDIDDILAIEDKSFLFDYTYTLLNDDDKKALSDLYKKVASGELNDEDLKDAIDNLNIDGLNVLDDDQIKELAQKVYDESQSTDLPVTDENIEPPPVDDEPEEAIVAPPSSGGSSPPPASYPSSGNTPAPPSTNDPGTTDPETPSTNDPGTTDPETPPTEDPGTTDPETPPTEDPGTTDPETPPADDPGTTDPETPPEDDPGTTDPETPPVEDPGTTEPEPEIGGESGWESVTDPNGDVQEPEVNTGEETFTPPDETVDQTIPEPNADGTEPLPDGNGDVQQPEVGDTGITEGDVVNPAPEEGETLPDGNGEVSQPEVGNTGITEGDVVNPAPDAGTVESGDAAADIASTITDAVTEATTDTGVAELNSNVLENDPSVANMMSSDLTLDNVDPLDVNPVIDDFDFDDLMEGIDDKIGFSKLEIPKFDGDIPLPTDPTITDK